MNLQWDYSKLAKSYEFRPEYSKNALEELFNRVAISSSAFVCDIGAGTGHLTTELIRSNWSIDAIEPNDSMRAIGESRIHTVQVKWHKGTGEHTGMPVHFYDMVTFGSSFNVVDQQAALNEVFRILKPQGWFVCMWNHRDLEDSTQKNVEDIIKRFIPDYDYGKRRIDPTSEIETSGFFQKVYHIEGRKTHSLSKIDWINGWYSHATLQRQAGDTFERIIGEIGSYVESYDDKDEIEIPYVTKIWFAQKRQ